jgi:hypothetical protein
MPIKGTAQFLRARYWLVAEKTAQHAVLQLVRRGWRRRQGRGATTLSGSRCRFHLNQGKRRTDAISPLAAGLEIRKLPAEDLFL